MIQAKRKVTAKKPKKMKPVETWAIVRRGRFKNAGYTTKRIAESWLCKYAHERVVRVQITEVTK